MKNLTPAVNSVLLLWLIANLMVHFLLTFSPAGGIAAFLPAFVFELHETVLSFFTARSVY